MTIWEQQWSLEELQAACRDRNLDINPRPTKRQCRKDLDDYEARLYTSGPSDPSSSAPPPTSAQSQDLPTRAAAAGAPMNDGVPSDQGWTCMDGCGATFATAARARQHEVQVHNIPYPKVINGIDGRCPCGCGLEWLSPVWFRSQHRTIFDFPIPLIRPVILARRASSPQLSTSMPRMSNTSGEQETSNGHNTATGQRGAVGNGSDTRP